MTTLFRSTLLCSALLASGCAASGIRPSRPVAAPASSAELPERQILVTFRQAPTEPAQGAVSTPKPYGGAGRYKVTPRTRRTAERLARDYSLRRIDEWPIRALGVHCVVFEVPAGAATEEILGRLEADPRVESAQPMQLFDASGGRSYDDPYLHLQYGIESMQIRQAHRWAVGDGVTVAIVDSGVDLNHPELAGRVSTAEDFVGPRRQRPTADLHGTAVAGVIASTANNGVGIVGVAPSARVMALKACWEPVQRAKGARCSSFTLAKAIAFVVAKAPDVMNLSLTGPPDPLLERLVKVALRRGTVVVASQGEPSDSEPQFPSSLEGVIAVGNAGQDARQWATGEPGGQPAVRAPGKEILTLTPDGSYDFMSGSSFAAAHVSGVAALLLELEPRLGASRLRRLLVESSTASGTPLASAPVVNACAALARLVPEAGCTPAATGN
jgi:hypothetical protein